MGNAVQTPVKNPAVVTLDVSGDAPSSLRRRLRSSGTASLLPGGVCLEDAADALTYHFPAMGGWVSERRGDEMRFRHADGHVLVVGDCGATLTVAR